MNNKKIYTSPEVEIMAMKSEGFLATSAGDGGFNIPPFDDGIDITDPLS